MFEPQLGPRLIGKWITYAEPDVLIRIYDKIFIIEWKSLPDLRILTSNPERSPHKTHQIIRGLDNSFESNAKIQVSLSAYILRNCGFKGEIIPLISNPCGKNSCRLYKIRQDELNQIIADIEHLLLSDFE